MRARGEPLDPLFDALEGVLVGQVEAVDDPHHAAEEELAQRLVLVLAGCVPVSENGENKNYPWLVYLRSSFEWTNLLMFIWMYSFVALK